VLQTTELLAAGLALPASTAVGPLAAVGGERGAPSLVVLPFADLSEAGDQAYFADGVAEEVLNLLGST
jgi:adenylate cyclase